MAEGGLAPFAALRQTGAIAGAELRKIWRDPTEIFSRSVQPTLWLLIFGQVFARTHAIPTGRLDYLAFMTPGILAQSVLFTGIFYGIAIIWERDLGIVHKLLVQSGYVTQVWLAVASHTCYSSRSWTRETMGRVLCQRVLIIDDNVDLAENIAEILQIDGHLTQVAASAEEALSNPIDSELDVVVTDYRLPGINGADFVKQFRQIRTRVRAVVISAYTDEETIKHAKEAGATFMPKPVDFKLLGRFVREASA